MRLKLLMVLGGISLAIASILTPKIHAYTRSISIYTTHNEHIKIGVDTIRTTITKTITLNAPSSIYLSSNNKDTVTLCPHIATTKTSETLRNIKVIDAKTKHTIPFSTTHTNECTQITYNFPRNLVGQQQLTAIITFDEPIPQEQNQTIDLTYPALSNYTQSVTTTQKNYKINKIHNMTVTYNIPKNTKYWVLTPSKFKITTTKEYTSISFDAKDFQKNGIYLIIGSKRTVRFRINVHPAPQSPKLQLLISRIRIGIPTDSKIYGQSVYAYNNLKDSFASYIKRVQGSHALTINPAKVPSKLDLIVNVAKVNRTIPADRPADIPPGVYQQALELSQSLNYPINDPKIQSITKSLHTNNMTIKEIVEAVVDYVTNNMEYDENFLKNPRDRLPVLKTLETKQGVCMEYADLTTTLLLSLKIPARPAFGYLLYPKTIASTSLDSLGHQWIEVYFPSVGWVPVDPTLAENIDNFIDPPLAYVFISNDPTEISSVCIGPLNTCKNTNISLNVQTISSTLIDQQKLVPLNTIQFVESNPTLLQHIQEYLTPFIDQMPLQILITLILILFSLPLLLIRKWIKQIVKKST